MMMSQVRVHKANDLSHPETVSESGIKSNSFLESKSGLESIWVEVRTTENIVSMKCRYNAEAFQAPKYHNTGDKKKAGEQKQCT